MPDHGHAGHGRLRIRGLNRLGKALQAVDHGDQDVPETARLQLVYYPQTRTARPRSARSTDPISSTLAASRRGRSSNVKELYGPGVSPELGSKEMEAGHDEIREWPVRPWTTLRDRLLRPGAGEGRDEGRVSERNAACWRVPRHRTLSSKPGSRRACFSTTCGSNFPSGSRGTSSPSRRSPSGSCLASWPLRCLPVSCSPSCSRCASVPASSVRSVATSSRRRPACRCGTPRRHPGRQAARPALRR